MMMLNDNDIQFIKDARKEVRANREELIMLNLRAMTGSHPVTDEPIYEVTNEEVSSVVTIVTAVGQSGFGNDKEMIDGIKVVTGDIVVDINLEDFPNGFKPKDVNTIDFEDILYKVISFGTLGLGGSNRVELLGRRAY